VVSAAPRAAARPAPGGFRAARPVKGARPVSRSARARGTRRGSYPGARHAVPVGRAAKGRRWQPPRRRPDRGGLFKPGRRPARPRMAGNAPRGPGGGQASTVRVAPRAEDWMAPRAGPVADRAGRCRATRGGDVGAGAVALDVAGRRATAGRSMRCAKRGPPTGGSRARAESERRQVGRWPSGALLAEQGNEDRWLTGGKALGRAA